MTYELGGGAPESFFPPALQPTLPVLAVLSLWHADAGPLGRFALAQLRLTCRSGVRPAPVSRRELRRRRAGARRAERAASRSPRGPRASGSSASTTAWRAASRWTARARSTSPALGAAARSRPGTCSSSRACTSAETPEGAAAAAGRRRRARDSRGARAPAARSFRRPGPSACPQAKLAYPVAAFVALCDVTLPHLRFACRARRATPRWAPNASASAAAQPRVRLARHAQQARIVEHSRARAQGTRQVE